MIFISLTIIPDTSNTKPFTKRINVVMAGIIIAQNFLVLM